MRAMLPRWGGCSPRRRPCLDACPTRPSWRLQRERWEPIAPCALLESGLELDDVDGEGGRGVGGLSGKGERGAARQARLDAPLGDERASRVLALSVQLPGGPLPARDD